MPTESWLTNVMRPPDLADLRERAKRLRRYYDRAQLLLILSSIASVVFILDRVLPHYSAAIVILIVMFLYGLMVSIATLHRRRQLKKQPPTPPPPYTPSVSVVIAAHNEERVIAETVEALFSLEYPHTLDIWVMDDRSTDGTRAALDALLARSAKPFHIVTRPPEAMPGKSAVLNDALALTDSDVLLILDADARLAPDVLLEALPALADTDVGAVQVRKVINNRDVNLLTRCQYHEYLMDAYFQRGRDIIRGAVELRGNGQLVKRHAVEEVGGWTVDSITDDLDLSTKLALAGWDIRFLDSVCVYEEGITTLKPLLKQRRRWAEGSLRRYLDYIPQVYRSPEISLRTQLDLLAYFTKFFFPVWVLIDLITQLVPWWVFHNPPAHLISSLVMVPTMAVFFVLAQLAAFLQYEKQPPLRALRYALETAHYMLLIWLPVVTYIIGKILFFKDEGPYNWAKTEHGHAQPA